MLTLSLRSIVNEIMKQICVHGVSYHYSRAVEPIFIKFFLDDHVFPSNLSGVVYRTPSEMTFTNQKVRGKTKKTKRQNQFTILK
jgi:hypothetical protein